MKGQLIKSYKNGNTLVSIFSDGTKIRNYEGIAQPEYPESMDLKITNYCAAGCQWCHEKSTTEGNHGDLKKAIQYLQLPAGVEIAIGGGNPLDHPDYIWFIKELKKKGLIPNTTINTFHIIKKEYRDLVLQAQELCYALGISYSRALNKENSDYLKKDNTVIHLIAGVDRLEDIDRCIEMGFKKFLVLGYKVFGRGEGYYNERIEKNKMQWYVGLEKYFGKVTISFDNLAIKQLNVKKWIGKDKRESFYMGDDGKFTMYIDAVNDEFSVCSFSKERYKTLPTIKDMFYFVKSL